MNKTIEILDSEKKPHTMLTQVPRKKALVLSTPRTGSVYVSELLYCHYLATYPRTRHLGEFLNPYHFNLFFEDLPDGTKKNHLTYEKGRYMLIPGLNKSGNIAWARAPYDVRVDIEQEIDRRLGLLSQVSTTFVLHHHLFTEDLFNRLNTAVDFDKIIVCRRKSIWDQILSYGIAFHTKRFKYVAGSEFALGAYSVTMDKAQFDTLLFRIKTMEKIMLTLAHNPKVKILWYEDIKDTDTADLLVCMGLPPVATKEVSTISVKVPYTLDIEQYYAQENLREITKWYNDEFHMETMKDQ